MKSSLVSLLVFVTIQASLASNSAAQFDFLDEARFQRDTIVNLERDLQEFQSDLGIPFLEIMRQLIGDRDVAEIQSHWDFDFTFRNILYTVTRGNYARKFSTLRNSLGQFQFDSIAALGQNPDNLVAIELWANEIDLLLDDVENQLEIIETQLEIMADAADGDNIWGFRPINVEISNHDRLFSQLENSRRSFDNFLNMLDNF